MAETTKAPPRRATPASSGDLLDALMSGVRERVDGVRVVENESRTYSRLQVGKRTFAYIFPPRAKGVAVKIPKHLLGVERQLPAGHGFHRVGWGLTKTVSKKGEVAKTAQALAVAAAHAVPKDEA